MIVGMWMSRHLIVAPPEMRVTEAARLMKENRIRRLPVARSSEDLHLLGIVSVTDIYRSLPPGSNLFSSPEPAPESALRVREIMTADVLTTTPETPIEDAATIMRDRKIGALPVIRENLLVGLVTESDIFRAFISILHAEPGATRVTFQVAAGEDVFELLAKRKQTLDINVLSLMSSQRDNRVVCVARLSGPDVQRAIDDLWKSGHHVINVLNC